MTSDFKKMKNYFDLNISRFVHNRRQLLDIYKQVTNTAGEYQVPGVKKVAMLNIGGTSTTNVYFTVE